MFEKSKVVGERSAKEMTVSELRKLTLNSEFVEWFRQKYPKRELSEVYQKHDWLI